MREYSKYCFSKLTKKGLDIFDMVLENFHRFENNRMNCISVTLDACSQI